MVLVLALLTVFFVVKLKPCNLPLTFGSQLLFRCSCDTISEALFNLIRYFVLLVFRLHFNCLSYYFVLLHIFTFGFYSGFNSLVVRSWLETNCSFNPVTLRCNIYFVCLLASVNYYSVEFLPLVRNWPFFFFTSRTFKL